VLFAACSSDVMTATGGAGGGSSSSGTTIGDTSSSGTSSSSSGTGGVPGPSVAKKLDLLLEIDNSRSMADKQAVLAEVLPDLVGELVNPKCIDPTAPDETWKWQTPAGPNDPCPSGLARLRQPVFDVHVGVITTSIGGHGADACPDSETFSCPGGAANKSNDDHGHLVSRLDPCGGGKVATYQDKGFLAWDPKAQLTPPGESEIGALNVDVATGAVSTATPGLVPSLKDLVLGVGQIGCGYEATLESWYRFLVDPTPYQTIAVDTNQKAQPMGIDDVLLQQRADFLRSDSLLAIVMLTDENDCSIKEYGQFYFAAQQRQPFNPNESFYLPKPRSECATNPNDLCCRSCGQDQSGCPADPNCTGSLDAMTDDVNLRCWDQKRRFGIDFLYPIDRYVTGLTQPIVPDRQGNMVPNPIFSVLDPSAGTGVRDPSLVYLAAVVGVPWQDIARDPADLKKGYKNTAQLAAVDSKNHTTWDYVVGDPSQYVAPLDPHMWEWDAPRSGTNPITGDTIAPPSKTEGGTDALNGHEFTPGTKMGVQTVPDELMYACIFELQTPRDCTDPTLAACDCTDPLNDNPLCADNGAKGRTLQTHAKGYPGIRPLSLIKALGPQGVVGSICPRQLDDLAAADFGYRPFVSALMEGIGGHLP